MRSNIPTHCFTSWPPRFVATVSSASRNSTAPLNSTARRRPLLTCELQAVGYRRLGLAPLAGNLGYLANLRAARTDRAAET